MIKQIALTILITTSLISLSVAGMNESKLSEDQSRTILPTTIPQESNWYDDLDTFKTEFFDSWLTKLNKELNQPGENTYPGMRSIESADWTHPLKTCLEAEHGYAGNPHVLAFIVNHPKCLLTRKDFIETLLPYAPKLPTLIPFLTSRLIEREGYRLTTDDIYKKSSPPALSPQNIFDLKQLGLGPTTIEEQLYLYQAVFIMSTDMTHVQQLFAHLKELLPDIKYQDLKEDYKHSITQQYCTGDFEKRNSLRKNYLNTLPIPEDEKRLQEEAKRKAEEAERESIAKKQKQDHQWMERSESEDPIQLDVNKPKGILSALHGHSFSRDAENNYMALDTPLPIRVKLDEQGSFDGRLTGVFAECVSYEYEGIGAYGTSKYKQTKSSETDQTKLVDILKHCETFFSENTMSVSNKDGKITLTLSTQRHSQNDYYNITFHVQTSGNPKEDTQIVE